MPSRDGYEGVLTTSKVVMARSEGERAGGGGRGGEWKRRSGGEWRIYCRKFRFSLQCWGLGCRILGLRCEGGVKAFLEIVWEENEGNMEIQRRPAGGKTEI